MQHSEQFAQVAAALGKAQGAFPVIPRDREVVVQLKDRATGAPKGSYKFRYALLFIILEKCRPALAANGLALVQAVMLEESGDGKAVEILRTTLVHESGEWLSCDVPIYVGTGDNKSQAYSSGVTYSRRYGVTLLLCISADEDDDGNGGDQDEEDRARPDYHRQDPEPYRGRFPRGRDGYSDDKPAGGPKPPARKAPAPEPAGNVVDGVNTSTGEVVSPYGADLTPGQVAMARQRAEIAELDDAGVLALCGLITLDNVAQSLKKLKTAADAAAAAND